MCIEYSMGEVLEDKVAEYFSQRAAFLLLGSSSLSFQELRTDKYSKPGQW